MGPRAVQNVNAHCRPALLDRLYVVGVLIKGIDAVIEVAVGIALIFAPSALTVALRNAARWASHSNMLAGGALSVYLDHLEHHFAHADALFVIVFLTAHGVIKTVLAYCLLRRLYRAYPP
jgi:uncharacterized membrane protein